MLSNLITQYWFELIYHEILFATLLFLIIWPLSYLLKNKSPHWKYYLWVLLFVRLILPTNFSLPGNVWQIIDEFELFNWINISSETINLSVFENELSDKLIQLNIECGDEVALEGWEHDLYWALTNLLENSIYWLSSRKSIKNRYL